ncbi:MAG: serine hydrolase domain-containing protein [Acidobacteriota bacterium]
MTPVPAVGAGAAAESRLRSYLEEQVRGGLIPGAAWVVARQGLTLTSGAVGWSQLLPRRRRARLETVYDLASLTKPLVTAALAVLLAREGRVSLEEPAAGRLPELAGSPYAPCTLLDLLLHRSGLPAWEPLYLHGTQRGDYLCRMALLPPVGIRGRQVVYSDLGYIAAGILLERAAGSGLSKLFQERIGRILGNAGEDLSFRPPRPFLLRAAPTEMGNRHEEAMAVERAGSRARGYRGWRQDLIQGQVHDQNAWALGGVSGHAGLFGSAPAVAVLGREFLPGSRLFKAAELTMFTTSGTQGLGEDRTVGFHLAAAGCPAAGLSPRSYGHVGFTGTSLFLDPETATVFVLLTNRVHPRCREADMKAFRRGFHRLAARLLAGS